MCRATEVREETHADLTIFPSFYNVFSPTGSTAYAADKETVQEKILQTEERECLSLDVK